VEIDRNRNVGIINIIKNASMTYDKVLIALNAGWNFKSDTEEGYFNFCRIICFCEDYKRVVINALHEMILLAILRFFHFSGVFI